MSGMYPDDQVLEIFGEQVLYPGLDPETHKFTDGDFSDPLKKPSHIPAATFNLLIDNMENLISAMGFEPNNTDPEQLLKAIQRGFEPRFVGKYVDSSVELSISELASLRLLPLNYQIIRIALYEELCERKWVGAARNATALFWYKCNEDGTRNVDGQYMRVEDFRGIFPRVAGQNAVLRTDMNNPLSPPYDGKATGLFSQDTSAIQNGEMRIYGFSTLSQRIVYEASGSFSSEIKSSINADYQIGYAQNSPAFYQIIRFGAPRSSYENAGAWIAEARYMHY